MSRDPAFPAVPSVWRPLGFGFLPLPGVCRAQEWGCVPQRPSASAPWLRDGSWSWHRAHGSAGASHPRWDLGTSPGMGVPARHIPLCPPGPGAAGRLLPEQESPPILQGPGASSAPGIFSSSSRGKGMPGRDGREWQGTARDGGKVPPLQPREKALGLRVVTRGSEEPPRVRGQLVAGNAWQS